MPADARYNTKVWIETYYTPANAIDDNGHALGIQVMYDSPEYSLEREFKAPSVVDVIITIGQPNSAALIDTDQTPYGYEEHVPIGIYSMNKSGVTATKAIWQVEAELRRIAEEHPEGSLRSFENRRPADKILGSTTQYGSDCVLIYTRGTT